MTWVWYEDDNTRGNIFYVNVNNLFKIGGGWLRSLKHGACNCLVTPLQQSLCCQLSLYEFAIPEAKAQQKSIKFLVSSNISKVWLQISIVTHSIY